MVKLDKSSKNSCSKRGFNNGKTEIINYSVLIKFFFITYLTPVNGKYDWGAYNFQGFIYNPFVTPEPTPSQKRNKWLYCRAKRINIKY